MALKGLFSGGGKRGNASPTAAELDSPSSNEKDAFDCEKQGATGGGPQPRKMSRIDGPIRKGSIVPAGDDAVDSAEDASVSVGKQRELEADNAIKYRTCSWQKTAALLFSEYICLAIMSFPYSYSILGLVPGIILTVVVAGIVLYTSLIVWEFSMRHPEVRDVCDIGQLLFWNYRWAWWFTAVMFILNNTFIQGFHCLTGAKWFNTISNHGTCTIAFTAIWAILSWLGSLPRTFDTLSKLAGASAFFTFISVLLAAVFAGVEDHPAGFDPAYPVDVLAVPARGTKYVAGMSAFLNISYTFIGQITLPSFIAEMREPRDFPKALWAVTIAEVITFSVCGAVTYAYTGTTYNTSPAFGSLGNHTYQLVAFSFMFPTMVFLGILYASVSARFVFFNLFAGTRHLGNHTVVGWTSWAAILAATWILAFIIAEVIPFFSDLLSLMSSLFDSFFGFIFWGVAYIRMRQADYGSAWFTGRGWRGYAGGSVNIFLICMGFYFLGPGTYVSVESILEGYRSGSFGGPFKCADNGLTPADPTAASR